jgi:hypothetical protein
MAAITSINASGVSGSFAATESILSADDTITMAPGKCQLLVLRNATAGELTVTVDGSGGTTVAVSGLGMVSVAAGYAIVLAAGAQAAVILSSISKYCQGVVHLTGGTLVKAQLFDI